MITKKALLLIYLLILTTLLYAGGSSSFSLDLKKDLITGVSSILLFGTGQLLTGSSPASTKESFGWSDEYIDFKYSETFDNLGDVLMTSSILSLPFLVDNWSGESISTVSVIYLESFLMLYGVKNIMKSVISRPRPYNFITSDGVNEEKREDNLSTGDRNFSFPSGHTALSFMTATFSTYVYSKGSSTKKSKWIMGVSLYSLALATAGSRVYSGVHYPLDLAAGAIIGVGIGLFIPSLHLNHSKNSNFIVSSDFLGFSIKI